MLSSERAIAIVAKELEAPPPPPDADGGMVFELAESLRLGIHPLADGSGLIAWSVVSQGRPGESPAEVEARAGALLRAHLGRLRRSGAVTATMDETGAGILYIKATPATEKEWLDTVAALLNEAEALRKILSASAGSASGSAMGGGMSLFGDMSGYLKNR